MTNDKKPSTSSSASDEQGKSPESTAGSPSARPDMTTPGTGSKGDATEADPARSSKSKQQTETAKPRRGGFIAFLAMLALLLALGGIAAGYWAWLQIDRRLTAAAADNTELTNTVDRLAQSRDIETLRARVAELDAAIASVAEDLKTQQKERARLRQALEGLEATVGNTQRDWMIAEAKYLMRIAQHRLRLARDIDSAIAALEASDRRLAQLGDPLLIPVREALAEEISALENYLRPDSVGVALELEQMISSLAPPAAQLPAPEGLTLSIEGTASENGGLQGFFDRIWAALSQHITVRRNDRPLSELPSDESQVFAQQMLRLRLEAARLAALNQDAREYRRQLGLALEWVGTHYSGEAGQQLTHKLKALGTKDIRPELPEIGQALVRLRGYENRIKEETS